MASPAQIIASRANAQLSTGPRSIQGKAVSSRNAMKFGIHAQSMIIPGEDPAELELLTAEYEDQYDAEGPIEAALLQSITRGHWMQIRYARIESEYLSARVAALPEGTLFPLGAAMIEDAAHGNTLQKIFRRQQAAERDWNRAMDQLNLRQTERFGRESEPEADPETDAETEDELLEKRLAAARALNPLPPGVRFDGQPFRSPRTATAPPENLALRL